MEKNKLLSLIRKIMIQLIVTILSCSKGTMTKINPSIGHGMVIHTTINKPKNHLQEIAQLFQEEIRSNDS